MKPPMERNPHSLVIFLVCVAILFVIAGFAVATGTPTPDQPSPTHKVQPDEETP